MSATAQLIWSEFGSKCDLYDVLGVARDASDKEITRAYRKLALRYHPDKHRGDEASRAKSTTTFQAVSAIHQLLLNKDTRALYDETGTIGAADDMDLGATESPSFDVWVEYFARLFPKVTQDDIDKFEKQYRFSEEERSDVVAAYTTLEGSMKDILDSIMLCTDDDEDRFAEIIEAALKADKTLKLFAAWKEYRKKRSAKPKRSESDAQKKRRDAKKEKEAKEADELMNMIRSNQKQRASGSGGALALTVKKRERDFSSLISNLEAKYADSKSSKKGKKAKQPMSDEDEPSEEAFLAAQQRVLKGKSKRT